MVPDEKSREKLIPQLSLFKRKKGLFASQTNLNSISTLEPEKENHVLSKNTNWLRRIGDQNHDSSDDEEGDENDIDFIASHIVVAENDEEAPSSSHRRRKRVCQNGRFQLIDEDDTETDGDDIVIENLDVENEDDAQVRIDDNSEFMEQSGHGNLRDDGSGDGSNDESFDDLLGI
ncbi:OLC1v1019184C1 [Oldenlandia corymbosa var. corymbosa]|uniref:OLC1v1019184C1 n=1 Tax=Oldenlandia corymbosa var. corymbosa TaxID=529605 RepID=A0AAV1EDC5_OLDCO|nr:OLC1v1019184C1 [Oldenlandia corymbosa var. corymbosa]